MKLKSLLSVALLAGAALSASASFPLQFGKYAQNLDFQKGENGYPVVAADGSVTYTTASKGGIFFTTDPLTEVCPDEYVAIAFDYKVSASVDDIVLFHNTEGPVAGKFTMQPIVIEHGGKFRVSAEWNTVVCALDRTTGWGNAEKYAKSFLSVSSNDAKATAAGFNISVKDIRLLTASELEMEQKNIGVGVSLGAHYGTTESYDEAEKAILYGVPNGGVTFWYLSGKVPSNFSSLKFEYKYSGASWTFQSQLAVGGAWQAWGTAKATIEDTNGGWKVAELAHGSQLAEHNWGQNAQFPTEFLWQTMIGSPAGAKMHIRNMRFVDPNYVSTGLESIVAERPVDTRIFNLMGVEVKGDLAPGIYIQGGKKFMVR